MEPAPTALEPVPAQAPSGLHVLAAVAAHHGVSLSADGLARQYGLQQQEPSDKLLLRLLTEAGFKAKAATLTWRELMRLGDEFPFIATVGKGRRVVLSGARKRPGDGVEEIAIVDIVANPGAFTFLTREEFERVWGGQVILVRRRTGALSEERRFGLGWFLPLFHRERRTMTQVLVASVALVVLGLGIPIFFQIVIDKVLLHEARDTLAVLGLGIMGVVAFEAMMTYLRGTLLLHATTRIDATVARRTFGHLVSLPLPFFETSASGVLVKHMQQPEVIREFMSNKLINALIDMLALFVFVPVLFWYDVRMASLIVAFSLASAAVIFVLLPIFRRALMRLYDAEGQRQSLLVEAIHGMRTVKSLTLEPMLQRVWGARSAEAIQSHYDVAKVSISARALVGLIEKLMVVAIIWVGATLVFAGDLTVGGLVAINMLAGRVSQPVSQLVALVNEFQQTSLSIRMLGEIMNRRPETAGASTGGARPKVRGGLRFEDVTFAYPTSEAKALEGVSFDVPPGTTLGLVGRSGSGKSTITRLIQGLYAPSAGTIRIDGVDIREFDLGHLRRNVGVVLQDSFLFRGSVRENIAVGKPSASLLEVHEAAELAGAAEFVERLPQGYDTMLEENAHNLSGGQRQRLAIARALLVQPPILIFDEATSALDPESEAIVQANLSRIAEGRTLIVVSHRLSSLVHCDAICVLDRGEVQAVGPHRDLLRDSALYLSLWNRQNQHLEAAE